MLIQPQVGPLATTSSLAAGQQPAARAGNMGELIVSELHGRYYEAAYRKTMFSAANQAGATTTVGLATTYTGICLSNPINSTVNVVVQKVGYAQLVAFTAAAVIAVAAGYNSNTNVTHTTPVTPRSNYFNNGTTGQALVDVAATLPTAPVYTHVLGTALTGAITTTPLIQPQLVDLEGSLILPPGGYAIVATSTASGTSGFWGSFAWEEVPL
jgi:hypothetical protein